MLEIWYVYEHVFLSVFESHVTVRLCPSCLQRFGSLKKTHTCSCVSIFWMFGHAETVPGHISRLWFWHVTKSILFNMSSMSAEMLLLCQFNGLPALCVRVAAACGALATSEQNKPLELLEYVYYGCLFCLDFRASPSPLRLCRSCLQRFGSLKKKHAPGCLGYLVDSVIF